MRTCTVDVLEILLQIDENNPDDIDFEQEAKQLESGINTLTKAWRTKGELVSANRVDVQKCVPISRIRAHNRFYQENKETHVHVVTYIVVMKT